MTVQSEVAEIIDIFSKKFSKNFLKEYDATCTTIAWIRTNYQLQVQIKGNGHAAIFMENTLEEKYYYDTDIAIKDIESSTKLWEFVETLTME